MRERDALRVATYNIHKCRGLDRRIRPERIAKVLLEIDADVIALQEVLLPSTGAAAHDQAGYLQSELNRNLKPGETRYFCCLGENRKLETGAAYGNAILSRIAPLGCRNYLLPRPRREQRGCLRADLAISQRRVLHVFNVHLGTGFMERRRQAPQLVSREILRHAGLSGPRLILGDFNEWTMGLTTRLLRSEFQHADLFEFSGRRRSYPGVLPLLHLDHVYYDRALKLRNFHVHRSRTALIASDHLPLVADFKFEN